MGLIDGVWQVLQWLWVIPQLIFSIPLVGGWIQTAVTLVVLWYGWKWMPVTIKERARPVVERILGGTRKFVGRLLAGDSMAFGSSPATRNIIRYEKRPLKRRVYWNLTMMSLGAALLFIGQHPDWWSWMLPSLHP